MTDICGSPPFPANSFDRILLDAPCSGFGQRPAISFNHSLAEVTSYPPLQRRLFETVFPSAFLAPAYFACQPQADFSSETFETVAARCFRFYDAFDMSRLFCVS